MVAGKELGRQMGEYLLAVRIVHQVDRGIGEREATGDNEIGGGEAEECEDDEFAAPAGNQVFKNASGATAIGCATDDIPIDREGKQERDEDDTNRGYRCPNACGLGGDGRQIGERAEIVDADQT